MIARLSLNPAAAAKVLADALASSAPYVGFITALLCFWQWRVGGAVSLAACATFAGFSWMMFIYGDFFSRVSPLPAAVARSLAAKLLFGFFTVNSVLAIVALASSFSTARVFILLAAASLVLPFVWRGGADAARRPAADLPDLLCLAVAGVAVTLWCADALDPVRAGGKTVIFRLWQDLFFHLQLIGNFSQSHGLASVSNLAMSGAPLVLYHYASYFTPAAIVSLTGVSPLDAYAGFQLPFGLLLTGLAAFTFAASLWGRWPGLAACCALLLLPDAYQQGFGVRQLGYNFLQQVNLAGLYGVACAAIAWIFILHGCRSGKYAAILFGYGFVLLTAFYKSQIFIAIAFLALIYPCLFFRGAPLRWRGAAAVPLVLVFCAAVWMSQKIPGVPVLRLDFSSAGTYSKMLLDSSDPGFLKLFFTPRVLSPAPKIILALYASTMILLASFGLWLAAGGAAVAAGRKSLVPGIVWFPLLVVLNYLVMSLGLAGDTNGVGTFDELLSRPMVWAYFALVVWTGGFGYAALYGDNPPRGRHAQAGAVLAVLWSLTVPWHFAPNLQTFPARDGYGSFAEFNAVPACLIQATSYIRRHSQGRDVVQDSEGDPKLVVAALTGARDLSVDVMAGRRHHDPNEPPGALALLNGMTGTDDLNAFAGKTGLTWYLLHPQTRVLWPEAVRTRFAFDCDGYRVYRFPAAP